MTKIKNIYYNLLTIRKLLLQKTLKFRNFKAC